MTPASASAAEVAVDGSFGEGGGQILRTSLALACITRRPVRVINIRARRKSPGLKPQHLAGALAAAEITGGALEGAISGSREIFFRPGAPCPGAYSFDVAKTASSAGATSLVYQTVLLPLAFAGGPSRVEIKGGTHVAWSPVSDYIKEVYLSAAAAFGIDAAFDIQARGYYPIGGGEVISTISPLRAPLRGITLRERGALRRVKVVSAVSGLPVSIARRQMGSALAAIGRIGVVPETSVIEAPSRGRGTYVFILAEFECVRAGFSALGEPGKKAEAVGIEAAGAFVSYMKRSGALDPHLSDQLLLPMALASGTSSATVAEVTTHLRTNVHVMEGFLPVKFSITGRDGEEGEVSVEGAGVAPPRPRAPAGC